MLDVFRFVFDVKQYRNSRFFICYVYVRFVAAFSDQSDVECFLFNCIFMSVFRNMYRNCVIPCYEKSFRCRLVDLSRVYFDVRRYQNVCSAYLIIVIHLLWFY